MSHTLITSLSLEGADGQFVPLKIDGRRHVSTVEGLVGLTARERVRARPGRHGILNTTRYRDAPPIIVTGELFGDDADDAWAEYNAVAAACAAAIDTDRQLRWEGGQVLDLMETRVRVSALSPPLVVAEDVIRYQLTLRPGDPRSFSQALSQAMGGLLSSTSGGKVYPYTYPRSYAPAGSGEANLMVGGTDKTPPLLTVSGLVISPTIRLVSTGEELSITGTIDSGRTLEVDVDARELRLDGVVRNDLLDYATSTWFELPPGPQSLQLLASTFDANAQLAVEWRNAYA